ncbi:hypothetical protein F4819DRAFT_483672 [Hypoxylon fuscum]|nr:hypothetical protein F4819DRAFT_483672 [Hypoxylon fuscum]
MSPPLPVIFAALIVPQTHRRPQSSRLLGSPSQILKPPILTARTFSNQTRSWKRLVLQLVSNGHDTRPPITRPSDVLTHWEDLAPQLAFDGASEFPADLAVVLQYVDSLEGPEWHKYREEHESVNFFEGWVCDGGLGDLTEEIASEQVRTAGEIIDQTVGLGRNIKLLEGGRVARRETRRLATLCTAVGSAL